MTISTCTSDDICTYLEGIQQTELPNLPTVIRYDSSSYLHQREWMPTELKSEQTFYENEERQDEDDPGNAFIEYQSSCSLYMAMSSIPNSGFGIYSGRDLDRGEKIDLMPQVVIPLIDFQKKNILQNYPWTAYLYGAHLEDEESKILYPGLGMLANSHLGLVNVMQKSVGGIEILNGPMDRRLDYGTGAYSLYHAASFNANTGIERGSELFLDYGEVYFHGREEEFVAIFPTGSNYREADGIVRKFAQGLGDVFTAEEGQAWKEIVTKLQDEGDEDRIRVAYALPDSVEDVKYAAEIGTARFSIPESIRSIEWLEESGLCLDNLRKGKSDIPHAGYGAFVMKQIKMGSIVAPMPLVPVTRDVLEMNTENDDSISDKNQLLLNYCFGHPDSSLLLFPYGSGTSFINHSKDPNAFIRWSSSDLSKTDNFDLKVEDVSTGIIMEVVALVDIPAGEEVTIDYGNAWVDAWNYHVNSWQIADGDPAINPAFTANRMNEGENRNKPIRTIAEQKESPYPKFIRTACYSSMMNGPYLYTVPQPLHLKFCDIVDRYRKGGTYFYDAKMKGAGDHVVSGIPQEVIKFVPRENCTDMHLQNAFRHEIQVVVGGMYPDLWLDLVNN